MKSDRTNLAPPPLTIEPDGLAELMAWVAMASIAMEGAHVGARAGGVARECLDAAIEALCEADRRQVQGMKADPLRAFALCERAYGAMLAALAGRGAGNTEGASVARGSIGDRTAQRIEAEAQALRGTGLTRGEAAQRIAPLVGRSQEWVRRQLSTMFPGREWRDRGRH